MQTAVCIADWGLKSDQERVDECKSKVIHSKHVNCLWPCLPSSLSRTNGFFVEMEVAVQDGGTRVAVVPIILSAIGTVY